MVHWAFQYGFAPSSYLCSLRIAQHLGRAPEPFVQLLRGNSKAQARSVAAALPTMGCTAASVALTMAIWLIALTLFSQSAD